MTFVTASTMTYAGPVVPGRFVPLRLAAALVGLLLLASGVVAVFVTETEAGSASLLGLGGLVLGVAIFSDRIESIEFAGAKLGLRDIAREQFALAATRESQGDHEAAAALRRQALALQRLAGTYAQIRRSMPGSEERTEFLDEVMGQASELAASTELDPSEIWRWFDEGADDGRIIALGLMEGDERLCDFFCALDAIEHPHSPFEQYYGFRVAHKMLPGLNDLERGWLAAAVSQARESKGFATDKPRMGVSGQIMQALDNAPAR
jgi:hypothetical protein